RAGPRAGAAGPVTRTGSAGRPARPAPGTPTSPREHTRPDSPGPGTTATRTLLIVRYGSDSPELGPAPGAAVPVYAGTGVAGPEPDEVAVRATDAPASRAAMMPPTRTRSQRRDGPA